MQKSLETRNFVPFICCQSHDQIHKRGKKSDLKKVSRRFNASSAAPGIDPWEPEQASRPAHVSTQTPAVGRLFLADLWLIAVDSLDWMTCRLRLQHWVNQLQLYLKTCSSWFLFLSFCYFSLMFMFWTTQRDSKRPQVLFSSFLFSSLRTKNKSCLLDQPGFYLF